MTSVSNMQQTNTRFFTSDIENQGFAPLDPLFKQHGWHNVRNDSDHICYTKTGYETDLFEIEIRSQSIRVGIPVYNSPYQYKTTFNNYIKACEYVELRMMEFVNEKKIE
jgi:hypothetical protein